MTLLFIAASPTSEVTAVQNVNSVRWWEVTYGADNIVCLSLIGLSSQENQRDSATATRLVFFFNFEISITPPSSVTFHYVTWSIIVHLTVLNSHGWSVGFCRTHAVGIGQSSVANTAVFNELYETGAHHATLYSQRRENTCPQGRATGNFIRNGYFLFFK
jgi:hypothetical protein